MPRICTVCTNDKATEVDRKLKAGATLEDVRRWLAESGAPVSRAALSRHRLSHVGLSVPSGPRPVSGDFLEAVKQRAHERLATGELEPSLRDGIDATKALDARQARGFDAALSYQIAAALTNNFGRGLPGGDEIEGEARELTDYERDQAEFRALLGEGR